MAREVWLRTNRRLLLTLALAPLGIGVASCLLMPWVHSPIAFWSLVCAALVSIATLVWTAWRSRTPRLAYENGLLEVYLTRQPLRVPIEIVECFFLGQGPSLLPAIQSRDARRSPETATLIVRLAESEHDWKHRDVQFRLGQWCEGYITIRGTFCEPLNPELAGRLNRRLVEVHRQLSETGEVEKA